MNVDMRFEVGSSPWVGVPSSLTMSPSEPALGLQGRVRLGGVGRGSPKKSNSILPENEILLF